MNDSRVIEIDPVADPRWDEYIRRHPDSSVYHLGAWAEILERSYRYKPEYLAWINDGRLAGVLPMVTRWGPLSRRRMISLPSVQTGGPLSDDEGGTHALFAHASELASRRGARLNIVARSHDSTDERTGVRRFESMPSWVLSLPAAGEQEAWLAGRSKNLRRSVKKGLASGLAVSESRDRRDLDDFYGLYLQTMRKHRSIPRLRRELSAAQDRLGPAFRLFVVKSGDECVAGGTFLLFKDTITLQYNASHPKALRFRPNHVLYRHVVDWAAQQGLKVLDFGGAWEGSSLAEFKAQWGAVAVPEWSYVRSSGTASPATPVTESDGSRETGPDSMLDGLWRRAPWLEQAWGHIPLIASRGAALAAYRYL